MNSFISIQWHGHSCFEIEAENYRIILDPYEDGTVNGLAPLKLEAEKVLCSHQHRDHNAVEKVKICFSPTACPFEIEAIPTFHDAVQGAERGENLVHILTYKGIRIAHFGDIGCRLSDEEIKQIGALDAAMIPIGGFYTISGKEAGELAKRLKPRVVIPMHYRAEAFGFDVLSSPEEFLSAYNAPVRRLPSINVQKGMESQVVFLEYAKN